MECLWPGNAFAAILAKNGGERQGEAHDVRKA
jgi:hypothetical protein